MEKEKDFKTIGDFYCKEFEYKSVKVLVEDPCYTNSILHIIDQNAYSDAYLRATVGMLIDFYKEYKKWCDYDTLTELYNAKHKDDNDREFFSETLGKVKGSYDDTVEYTKECTVGFFQSMRWIALGNEIIHTVRTKGGTNASRLKANVTKKMEDITSACDGNIMKVEEYDEAFIDNMLEAEREKIPTGIRLLDSACLGGLSRGGIGLFVAAQGVGKSTFLTLIANNMAKAGYNVLQVFFEDNESEIWKKHYSIFCNNAHIQSLTRPEVRQYIKTVVFPRADVQETLKHLQLRRWENRKVTVEDIEERINSLTAEGFKPDVLILDYFSCLKHSANPVKDRYKAEEDCMAKLADMAYKLNIAVWCGEQTNRTIVNSDTTNEGSIRGAWAKRDTVYISLMMTKGENGKTLKMDKCRYGDAALKWKWDMNLDNGKMLLELTADTEVPDFGTQAMITSSKKNQFYFFSAISDFAILGFWC